MSLLIPLVLTAASLSASPEAVPVTVPAGSHPRVFTTADEIVALRARAANQDWAAKVRDGMIEAATSLAADTLDIPHQGGQWSHWYTCKEDGGRLQAETPTRHVCQSCGAVYSGWPYDQVYVAGRHWHYLGGVRSLGLAYAFDPRPEFAARTREILLEYASFYSDLELHDVNGKKSSAKARLLAQTLDESVMLCGICLGYDLLYEADCFSPDDHARIESGLLRPMVETIQANDRRESNWQSWHNAAIAAAGFLLGDTALADWAIHGEHGFVFQMHHSLKPSGMWYEESPSYHWYALKAHLYLLEAAARGGADLYAMPEVKKMWDAPFNQIYPDLTFPPMNDSDRSSILSAASYYEPAYRRYRDPRYLSVMQPRNSESALLWGAEDIPADVPPLTLETTNDPGDGLAVLRTQDGQTALFFDYSQAGSSHVHPARLNITLFAHGEERFVDPGRLPYGNPLHQAWYKQTVAHNTFVVNKASQARVAAEFGGFVQEAHYTAVRALCTKAYEDTRLERCLLQTGNLILDLSRGASDQTATFDLPLHMRGEQAEVPGSEPIEEEDTANGYDHLKEMKRLPSNWRSFDLECGQGRRIHVDLLDTSDVYTAKGYGTSPRDLLPLVLRRQQGTQALFAAAYQVLSPGETPMAVEYLPEGILRVDHPHPEVSVLELRLEPKATVVETDIQGHTTEATLAP